MDNPLVTDIPLDQMENLNHFAFGWLDYALFGLLLLVSVLIGVYFGFFSKQDSTTEYFLGGKRMGCFPVAMSITASHISGISLLGIPTEVFHYGSQYAACVITSILTAVVTSYVFLPVFYKLQLTSTFEYLEIRFTRSVRILSSVLFTISLFMYLPIVIYVPALAFAQVSNLNVHAITPVLCIVCIVYTSIGGLKAVVWSDTVQFSVTVGGLFVVLVLGILSVGSVEQAWRISGEGGRLIFFDMDPSPLARNTFWSMTIGMTVIWLGHLGIHPGTVQRFLSVPREIDAKRGIAISAVGMVIVKLICVFTGLIMFAKYHDCDPFLTKSISRTDQTLPYYVMDVAGHLPGLPGLFVAGLVSAALATMSASLNTMSGTIYEDFINPRIPDSPKKEAMAANIMKGVVVVAGVISVGLVFLVERLGPIFQIAVSMRGVTDGPLFGLFVLGMLVPWANAKGALFGGCVGLISMLWLVGGAQWHTMHDRIKYDALPTSVDGCPFNLLNQTFSTTTTSPPTWIDSSEKPMILFQISFMYYNMIGAMIVVVVGTIASYVCGMDLGSVDPDHITPMMKRFLPSQRYAQVSLKAVPPSLDVAPEKN
ncbi:sodium-coupled monocarboxylate transporter 1 [Solenopsis invicta]|uniref:sodium-coupled monocarboxylate transporter 1 n=1 Tax=Solenopsis invicta TaxID=13686 RepID=UPI000595B9D4|nr:sodium-coupled monocarboxylate transporter 1 [Solenopsis invicta]XP_039302036.1 sodium-coupled monocarboxylate transporter 1 [Solenopsis invicta]XP_039302037.1 sodium-coupled monocarboxylate transporter 1 [Solenopsis invicta]XP_039302038.1 sodium-coupled monocarboxylate transporter 1 [Solenopsis invicta]